MFANIYQVANRFSNSAFAIKLLFKLAPPLSHQLFHNFNSYIISTATTSATALSTTAPFKSIHDCVTLVPYALGFKNQNITLTAEERQILFKNLPVGVTSKEMSELMGYNATDGRCSSKSV